MQQVPIAGLTTSRCSPGKSRGLGLVEIAASVSIIAIVLAFAIPVYLQVTTNMRIAGDGRDLESELSLAKMRAPAYFTQARVYADLAGQTFHLILKSGRKAPALGWRKAGHRISPRPSPSATEA